MENQLKKLLTFKIKLLILLLVSLFFITACSNKILNRNHNYKISYIGGELKGLYFSNHLKNMLVSNDFYNNSSYFTINASIDHGGEIYITNIDNTSDRERIKSSVNINIYDELNKCVVFRYNESISQFYVIVSSKFFESNNFAKEEIQEQNTEILIDLFINTLISNENKKLECI